MPTKTKTKSPDRKRVPGQKHEINHAGEKLAKGSRQRFAKSVTMLDLQPAELRQTFSIFDSVLAAHIAARKRLIERRSEEFEAERIGNLDELVASNDRTIATVKSALAGLERQLKAMEAPSTDTASGRS